MRSIGAKRALLGYDIDGVVSVGRIDYNRQARLRQSRTALGDRSQIPSRESPNDPEGK